MPVTVDAHPGERVVAVGIDTAGLDGIRAGLRAFGAAYLRRVCSPAEQSTLPEAPEERVRALGALWAAKEAVTKTLSPAADDAWPWPAVEIDAADGTVRLHGRPAQRAEALGVRRVQVWRAHDLGGSSVASPTAVAIAWGTDELHPAPSEPPPPAGAPGPTTKDTP